MNIRIVRAAPRISVQAYLDERPNLELVCTEVGDGSWEAVMRDTQNGDRVGYTGCGLDRILAIVAMCYVSTSVPGVSLYYDADRGLT